MIKVTPRARRHPDRAGDPLDGLVNLFDIGIVLAVAFLLAALASLGLSGAVSDSGLVKPALGEVTVDDGQTAEDVPANGARTVGRGTPVGTVYRLADGRLIYVTDDGAPDDGADQQTDPFEDDSTEQPDDLSSPPAPTPTP